MLGLIFTYPGSRNKVDRHMLTERDGILQLVINFVLISEFCFFFFNFVYNILWTSIIYFVSLLYEKLKLVVIILKY